MVPFECLNCNTRPILELLATFSPTECQIGPASCHTRAALDGVGAGRQTSVLFGILGRGDRGLAEPRSRYLHPSARDRGRPSHSWQMEAPLNANPTSSVSESSKGRAERSNKPSLRASVRNLTVRARSWLGGLVSFAFVRVLIIFVVGFAAGIAWQSYGGEARKAIAGWSPHLAWLATAPASASTSAERLKATSLALAAARQSFDKLTAEIGKLQVADIPDTRPGSRRGSQR